MRFLREKLMIAVGLVAAVLFSSINLTGQQDYVFIGEGGTGTTGASSVSPINPNTRNFRYQVLYTAAEIQAAGGIAGNINRLAWNVHQTAFGMTNYTIKMGHTTATSLSVHNTGATTQVYTTASYSASLGLNDITFSTAFSWNGTQNVIVEICYSRASTSGSGGSVYTTSGTSPTNRYVSNTSATPTLCATNTNFDNFGTKPQVRFYMNVAASCAVPSNLTAGTITSTTATFNWTAGSPSVGYTYAVTTSPTAPSSGTNSTGTSITINTGLSPATSYYFWMRNRCTASSNSDWISVPFSTSCIAPTLTTTGNSRCGSGSVTLEANPSAGTVYWWSAPSGGNLLGTGTTFNTPSISATTTYYASAGQALAGNILATLGAGASTSSVLSQTPFHGSGSYQGKSSNYLIRASELLASGIGAGYITSLGLDVVSAGGSLNTFYIKVGSTAATDLSSDFVIPSTYYYGTNVNGTTYAPTTGINTFSFSGLGFYWDGTSNVAIIINWENSTAPGTSSVKYDESIGFVANRYTTKLSGSWGGVSSVTSRPKFIINGKGLCMSANQSVVATINTGSFTYYLDADGDGFGNLSNSTTVCAAMPPAGYVTNSTDCNDALVTYQDNDGDGFGTNTIVACDGVTNNADCDDDNIAVWQNNSLYIDNDGDGYNNGNATVCYGASIPAGYSLTTLGNDCNDNNPAAHPGATEICGDGIDNNCNGVAEETCPAPNNDNPAPNNPVLSSVNYVYPNCFNMQGTTSGATVNPLTEAADVWYQFTAISNGVSIKVSSTVMDAKIFLYDATATNLLNEENETSVGNEVLNFGGLTAGNLYRIAVGSINNTAGPFTICVQQLRIPNCGTAAPYTLCSTFKSTLTGAANTSFSFTQGENTSSISSVGPITLGNSALGLLYDNSYSVALIANYVLYDGANQPESIQVPNPNACSITISAHPLLEVRANQRCTNGAALYRSSYLQAATVGGTICGVTGYFVEFTPVSNCNGDNPQALETFVRSISTASASISLNYAFGLIPLASNSNLGYWSVRWKPRFGVSEGEWGNPQVIAVNGTAPSSNLINEGSELTQNIQSVKDAMEVGVYPNPNNGLAFNLNVIGSKSELLLVRILDSVGQLVSQKQYTVEGSLNVVWSLSTQLEAGLYFIEISNGTEMVTQKLVVAI